MFDRRGGGDGEGQLWQDGRLEDPLRTDQGDSDALEVEAPFEDGARDGGFTEASALVGEKGEGAQADRRVAVVSHGDGAQRNRWVISPWAPSP